MKTVYTTFSSSAMSSASRASLASLESLIPLTLAGEGELLGLAMEVDRAATRNAVRRWVTVYQQSSTNITTRCNVNTHAVESEYFVCSVLVLTPDAPLQVRPN